MKLKKDYEIFIFIVGCILINYFGKVFTALFSLPFWLDSVGTVFAAYVLGPVCGAIVGATANIMYSIHSQTALFYGLTNIAVGVTVGICARKGFFNNIFRALSAAFLVTVLSVLISTPLNYILEGGSTGNIWGDGVAELLHELGWNQIISNIVGEFYLDFLDKVITILLLFFVIQIVRIKKERTRMPGKRYLSVLILISLFAALLPSNTVQAGRILSDNKMNPYNFHRYVQTIYNRENGLPGGASNDIAQTKDGVLWIGTYGGLYRYSGNSFQWMNEFESVKTVNCLYTDEAGRLWIGTNDNGLSICINQNISNVVNREEGLPSNSVRCITENSEGYYYVGTTDSLVLMTLSGGLKVYDTIPEIVYAENICADQNGNVAVVTNEGDFYLVHGTEIIAHLTAQGEGESYNCCTFDETGKLYVGTSANNIEIYQVSDKDIKQVSKVECENLSGINSLNVSEENTVFVCADNGVGYLDAEGRFCSIDTDNFNSSIDHMLIDYQGNIWFTSSRLGLLRLCPSVFSEIYEEAGLQENVVNTITKWNGYFYFGTDSGLDVVNEDYIVQTEHAIAQELQGVRIRCLMVDSGNNLWICTSDRGVLRVSENEKIEYFDSKKGTPGDKFRSVIETRNGEIVAAGDAGIAFIKDGKIRDTIGTLEGLTNPKVLSLYEREDGSILAGTDGNGIAVIKDGNVLDTVKQEDGLSSEIILRIVPDSDGGGVFIVTANGLCYMDENDDIRILDKFPYYNNFDLVEGGNGKLFVLGSAGIYVVDKADLLAGEKLNYELLDAKKGLRIALTPNSWNYIDENNNLYLSGDRGVISINMAQYDMTERSYRMLLQEIRVDGEVFPVEKGETINIPRGAKKIELIPEIINYSINDPDIRIYLEGFEKDAKIVSQSELESIVYTNLPSGEYTFCIAVLDSKTGNVIAENTYQMMKEKEIYDNWWFRFYIVAVAIIVISYLTWLFFRTQIQKTIRMQKMELEWTRRQLQMGNETILTIAKAVDAKDENTSQHSVRVSEYSVMIAKKLGYSEEACEELRKIATLHDIGKIGIPDSVLNKPARLTDEEYEIMKSHVSRGAEILKNFSLIDNVADGALYHHERYDGKGYIHGLKGEEIPLNARIIGIADAFDAMTANRVYRKKLDFEYVLEELRKGRGTQFDPQLVDILLGLIEDGTIDVSQIYGGTAGKES